MTRPARILIFALALTGCAHPKEVVVVRTLSAPTGLERQMEIDTQQMAHGAQAGEFSPAGMVERQLATVGMVRARKAVEGAIELTAELPTPGYRLTARVAPRPEQFCRIDLALVAVAPDGTTKVAETAPWWAIHALETVAAGLNSLLPPRLAPLDEARFSRLSAQAAALAQKGQDPPLSMEDYVRVPRPLDAGESENYFAPPSPAEPEPAKTDGSDEE
ncbi:MAG: hypothetical protein ACHQ17_01210 [Polyangia bacterium]